jgi:hypothetical protein
MVMPNHGSEGVTAPISVMLLVAVVVLLAFATMFFVNRLTDESRIDEPRVDLAFSLDDNNPTATVVRASDDLDWVRDLRTSGSCDPLLNGQAFPAAVGRLVQSGDVLECEGRETLRITSSDEKGNALLFDYTFSG